MAAKTTIPFQSIPEILTDLSVEWHSSDYYISPGLEISQPASYSPFRPDFYGLILCTEGWLDLKINGVLARIDRWCFCAGGPEMIFQRLLQSPGCVTRTLFFTKEFLLKNVINARQFESFDFFSNSANPVLQLAESDAGPLMQVYDVLKEKRTPTDSSHHLQVIRNVVFAYVYEAAIIYEFFEVARLF
jgi:hypothetical protein